MKFNIFWRYALAQIFDIAIILLVGWLVITGFLVPTLKMDYLAKITLGSASALYWVFLYTVYLPYSFWNGQTLMKKAFKLGVKYNVEMNFKRLFLVNAAFTQALPVMTSGISILINWFWILLSKKKRSLEQIFVNLDYYVVENKEQHLNYSKATKNTLEKKSVKQRNLHPNKNKRKR